MEDLNKDPRLSGKQAWQTCAQCPNSSFSNLQQFAEHLRAKHCTQEGGSFVCRYGDNNVCCTLPLEGVNDLDYERHVLKHHVAHGKSHSRKSSTRSEPSGERWTLHTTAQNLPAVLNDPKQGKQKDFFTKTWGDSFVEVADIPDPRYLPRITPENFQTYLKKTAKRHRKHARLNSVAFKPHSHAELLQTFPNLRVSPKSIEKNQFDIGVIPKIFLDGSFSLNNVETFNTVFPHLGQLRALPPTPSPSPSAASSQPPSDSAKILQEKLTHYLDIVEVQIAQQVSQKSDAFFLAMTSHDTLMEQLGHTISMVRTLREKINSIDSVLVKDSLTLIKCERTRANYLQVYNKLKLMSTVLQTQPTIQLLLSAPDYVAALDLIYTTQELLSQHLAGVHSFRHLGSELNEMVKVIGTLMTGEFERFATADLNRPLLESEDQVLQGDKLSCIVLGMLRRGCFDFIDAYQQETVSAIKAAVKQAVIEVVATSELAHRISGDASLDDQLKALATEEWTQLLKNAATTLRRLVRRVKKAADVMQHAADASAGISASQDTEEASNNNMTVTDYFLSAADHAKVSHKLRQLLSSTCQYTQERCAQLLSSKSLIWPDEKCPSITAERNKENANSKWSHWLAEKATLAQLSELYKHVELLSCECESVCSDAPASYLRSAFRSQIERKNTTFRDAIPVREKLAVTLRFLASGDSYQSLSYLFKISKSAISLFIPLVCEALIDLLQDYIKANRFMQRFHFERTTKLSLILDSESWKQTEVPVEFQQLLDQISETGKFSLAKEQTEEHVLDRNRKPANFLFVEGEKFAVVGTVLILVNIVAEYCVRAEDMSLSAANLLGYLAELLSTFNSRSFKLVLGAEAVSEKTGLKKITTANLALVLRALQLLLWLIPHIRLHFQSLLPESAKMTQLETVTRHIKTHVRDVQEKLVSIMEPLVVNELRHWEARPPVPSKSFQNICKRLMKLHEAIAGILPENQTQDLYRTINCAFKDTLRDQLMRMNIINNGGPQHGLVTQELTFYLEDLKRIKALPEEELCIEAMSDIWQSKFR